MPDRIQLSRAKGWRKPAGVVVVSRPTRWGNPWSVERQSEGPWSVHTWSEFAVRALPQGPWDFWRKGSEAACRSRAVAEFRLALAGGALRITVEDVQAELRAHDLACWCPVGQPCHGDVLLEIANA